MPVQRLPEFACGILLAMRFLERRPVGNAFRIGFYLIAVAGLLSTVHGQWLSLLVLPFAGLIYELASSRSMLARLLSSHALVFLGGASYSIYLLQFPVRNWVRLASSSALHFPDIWGALASPLLLIAFSCLVFHFYEEPLRRLLKRSFAALERRTARN
jgi:peptidoglycan/LPS O-acetylase OafA/YrhL